MTEKKKDSMTAINFRCSTELKSKLEILAFATQSESISVLIIDLCEKAVTANAELIQAIEDARKSFSFKAPIFKQSPVKKKNTKKKTAKSPTPITNAGDETANAPQDIAPLVDAAIMDGDTNEN